MEIKQVSEECLHVPNTQRKRTQKLNPFDRSMPNVHINLCFFYKNDGCEISQENMFQGLRIALIEYPEVAGTIEIQSNGDMLLHYDNHGVKVIRSKANFSLDDVVQKKQFQMNSFNMPQLRDQDDYLYIVHFITLTDNSLILITSFNHCLCDADGMTRFLNAWGCATRSGTVGKYVNNTDRSLITGNGSKPSDAIDYGYMAPSKAIVQPTVAQPTSYTSYTFVINLNKLDCLKKELSADLPDGQFLSKNDVLSAVFWKARVIAGMDKKFETSKCILVVNSRKRLSLPEGYFGNCAPFLCQRLNTQDILEMSLKDLAFKIRQQYSVMTKDFILNTLNWLEGQSFVSFNLHDPNVMKNDILVSSLARYPFYEVDFGFGKPVHVAAKQGFLPSMAWIFPSHDNKSLRVEFCLKKTEMTKFIMDENLNNLIDSYY